MNLDDKQTRAASAIQRCKILDRLSAFQPTVVSTIYVGLDTDDSDIDIVCTYDDAVLFKNALEELLENFTNTFREQRDDHIIARFQFAEFEFEIYASPIPITAQPAVVHYQAMQRLVALGGAPFQEQVCALKRQGQ